MMNRTQAMQILMLKPGADFDDVKYAYRRLSLEFHPDRNKDESDGKRFRSILEAYHFLKSQSRQKNSSYQNKSTRKKPEHKQNRYTNNYTTLVSGMKKMGFKCYLDNNLHSPIIVSFQMPKNSKFNLP